MRILMLSVIETRLLLPMWKNIIEHRKSRDEILLVTTDAQWVQKKRCGFFKKTGRRITTLLLFILHYGLCETVKKLLFKMLKNMCGIDICERAYSKMADVHSISYKHLRKPDKPALIDIIKKFKPDVIINQTPVLLGNEILSLPRYGVIGRHPSLLPKFKGCFPVFWALLKKGEKIGVTVYRLNSEIDSGEILCRQTLNYAESDSLRSVYESSYAAGHKLINEALDRIAGGQITANAGITGEPSYYGWPGLITVLRYFFARISVKTAAFFREQLPAPFWSMQSIISELSALFPRKKLLKQMRRFFGFCRDEWSRLPSNNKSGFKTMILVGGGPVPYTALYHRKHFRKIVVLEKNLLAFFISTFILKDFKNILLVRKNGTDFDYPDDSLIFISLLTEKKEQTIKKIRSTSTGSLICSRVPIQSTKDRYESIACADRIKPFFRNRDFGLQSMLLT